ncbi:hypothetical protein ACS0TY_009262 [Phlomoides rotata]
MALLVYSTAAAAAAPPRTNYQGIIAAVGQRNAVGLKKKRRLSTGFRVMASSEGAVVGGVTEVNTATFWPTVEAAGSKIVVLDMYTQWCGPCKVIAPKLKELCNKYQDVVFLKLDCNEQNRPLAKELGLKVVPTFKIFKDGRFIYATWITIE